MTYVIIKHVKTENTGSLPVILIDSQNEILEFDTLEKAEEMANLLQTNSHTQTKYEVKKI